LLAQPSKQKKNRDKKKKHRKNKDQRKKNTKNEIKDKAVSGLAQIDKAQPAWLD